MIDPRAFEQLAATLQETCDRVREDANAPDEDRRAEQVVAVFMPDGSGFIEKWTGVCEEGYKQTSIYTFDDFNGLAGYLEAEPAKRVEMEAEQA